MRPMKTLVFAFSALLLYPAVVMAQECGSSGSYGMTNCSRGDPNTPLIPTPFNPRPAGQDTVGPGRNAPATGFPAQDRNQMRGQTPPGTIAAH
jgi:hypothetical protein